MRHRTWSDEQLRDAIASERSWNGVRRRLGLAAAGSALAAVRLRAIELDLDVDHLPATMGGARRWTDEQLVEAVASSSSLHGVSRSLGLTVGGSAWRRLQEHIVRLGLDTSHWHRGSVRPGDPSARASPPDIGCDDETFLAALEGARSVAEVLRRLDLPVTSGAVRRRVRARMAELGIDVGALRGQGWAKGTSRPGRGRPLEEVLVIDSPYRGGTSQLRRRLVRAGVLEERCVGCERTTWLGGPVPLQLDHINGDARDNRLENLRLLCPNCHALTPTYCGRNIGGRYSAAPRTGT